MFNSKIKERIKKLSVIIIDLVEKSNNQKACRECGMIGLEAFMQKVEVTQRFPGFFATGNIDTTIDYFCPAHKKPYDMVDTTGKEPRYWVNKPSSVVFVTKDGKEIKKKK